MNTERLQKLKEWEQQKPEDAFLKFAIAQEYVSGQMEEEARAYFEILTQHFPDYLPTYYQFGNLYERLGEFERARDAYRKGMEVAKTANDLKTLRELNEALTLLEDE